MNKPIRKVGIAFAVMFFALFVNLNFIQVVKGDAYRDDSRNPRALYTEYSKPRGTIVVNCAVSCIDVATSKKTNDELKYLRVYPASTAGVYASVTGYTSYNYAPTGIEAAENSVLAGDDSRFFGSNLTGLLTGRDPRGGSVELTINSAAQIAAYKALAGRRGAVVALDPTSGAVLALVSSPSYNPNLLASHNSATIQRAYASLSQNPNQPLLNRAIQQVYPSGSVFKIIDSAAALSLTTQKITPTTVVDAPLSYHPFETPSQDNKSACGNNATGACIQNFDGEKCEDGHGTGKATLSYAFAQSCNTAYALLAVNKIGPTNLKNQIEKFGLDAPYDTTTQPDLCQNAKLEIPLKVCDSTPGPISDFGAPDTLAQLAIGQRNVLITPMQAAMLSAAVANGGLLMKPYLVARELDPDLSVLSETQRQPLSQVISQELDPDLIQLMEDVVSNGTGQPAQITEFGDAVKVGGKTGTADHCATNSSKCPPPHAWFTGFAMERGVPRIAVAVIIEDGGVTGSEVTGGKAAAPVAKSVMEAYLKTQPRN